MLSITKYANAKKKNTTIKQFLHEAMCQPESPRSIATVHASDLTGDIDFCPREVVLSRLLVRPRKSKMIDTSLRYTFDEGTDKQKRLNNDWLRSRMVGDWKCLGCGKIMEWSRYPKGAHCSGRGYEYQEVRFTSKHGFSGGIDGLVDLGLPKLRMVECKIMSNSAPKFEFKSLQAPLAEHRVRTRTYLRLIAESNLPHLDEVDTSVAHVLYMLRGYGIKQDDGIMSPFKEYLVTRDDGEIEDYYQLATAVEASKVTDYKKIPLGICPSPTCKRASDCRVLKECFSGEYKGSITWQKGGVNLHE